jgi:RNA polymerase sigma-70 factor (ECF subfamily)
MADAVDEGELGSSTWVDPALQFELLYEQESDYVSRTIRGIVRVDAEVEDLVQECFARAYRARHRYRPDAPPGAWLHRIAVNTAISHLRRRKLDQVLPLEAEVQVADRDLRQAEARATLEQALAGLSPKVRAAVVLKHFEDRSREEIAATLGIPSGTVASRVAKGMALLRSRLDAGSEGADGA